MTLLSVTVRAGTGLGLGTVCRRTSAGVSAKAPISEEVARGTFVASMRDVGSPESFAELAGRGRDVDALERTRLTRCGKPSRHEAGEREGPPRRCRGDPLGAVFLGGCAPGR
ncbi:hypothetical protein GCM10017687_24700 [Streptomyces echinatus]